MQKLCCVRTRQHLCQFGLFRHNFTTVSPPILNHFWWELYHAEGGASFEQLQELIRKECDKRDKKYRLLENKYNKLQEQSDHTQSQKNMPTRGPKGASNKKKSHQQNKQKAPTQRGRSTSLRRPRSNTGQNGKVDGTNNDTTNDNSERQKRNRRSRSQQKKKLTNIDRNKLRQQSQTK